MSPQRPEMSSRLALPGLAVILVLGQAHPHAGPSRVLASTATSLTLHLQPGRPLEVDVETILDHRNLWDPAGYGRPRRHGVFVRRMELENTGQGILDRPWPVVNDRELHSLEGLFRTVGFGSDAAENARRWHGFWRGYRYHDTNRTEAAYNLFCALNFWSYTLCGEDFGVHAQLFGALGIESRSIPVVGHTAGEYFWDDDWHILDGDLGAVYLELDNRTFASFEDVRRDPFLVLRTKARGRYGPWQAEDAWSNASLFEHLSPEVVPGRVFRKVPVLAAVPWQLYPGEKLILHYDRSPEREAGIEQSQSREWLARVEMLVDLKRRGRTGGRVKVSLPFPILGAIYDSGQAAGEVAAGEPRMEVVLDPNRADRATVVAHAAVRSLPDPRKGRNRFSIPDGPATLTLHWSADPELGPPDVALESDDRFAYRPIDFGVRSSRELETVWWQMSEHRDFHFVPPNWDNVVPWAARFELDPISANFLTSGGTYYLRARGFDGRLWSDWSAVHELTVAVPQAPRQVELTEAGGVHRLSWAGSTDEGTRFLVFGSNRRDFLPEIFGTREVTEMRDLKIRESRANRNLLGATRQPELSVERPRRYYRIVAVKGRSYSVPTILIHARTGPPGRVLQTRLVAEPADNEEGYVSRYHALEAVLPETGSASRR